MIINVTRAGSLITSSAGITVSSCLRLVISGICSLVSAVTSLASPLSSWSCWVGIVDMLPPPPPGAPSETGKSQIALPSFEMAVD